MLRTLARRSAQSSAPPFDIHTNPYRAKRRWPPDFSMLPPKHQFRIERKYRRRMKLKWARPRWTKAVKLAQWGTSIFVVVYGVLFMDWSQEMMKRKNKEDQPFQGIRNWYGRTMDSIWTSSSTQRERRPESPSPPAS